MCTRLSMRVEAVPSAFQDICHVIAMGLRSAASECGWGHPLMNNTTSSQKGLPMSL